MPIPAGAASSSMVTPRISRRASSSRPVASPRNPPLDIRGIVGFAYAKLGSFIFGESPVASVKSHGSLVSLQGHVRLNGAEIVDLTSFERVLISPPDASTPDGKALADTIDRTLNRWNVTSPGTIISAQNADLGTMLSIRLDPGSRGTIDLLGAHVYTLDDHDDARRNGALGWGDPPTSVTPPAGVMLRLFGFTYTHIMADTFDSRPPHQAKKHSGLPAQRLAATAIPEKEAHCGNLQPSALYATRRRLSRPGLQSRSRRHLLRPQEVPGQVRHPEPLRQIPAKALRILLRLWLSFGGRPRHLSHPSACQYHLCSRRQRRHLRFRTTTVITQNASWPWLVEAQHPTTGPFDLNLHPVSVKAATTLPIDPSPPPSAQTTPASPNPAPPNACRCVTHKRRRHHSPPPPQPPSPAAQLGDTTGKLTPVAASARRVQQ